MSKVAVIYWSGTGNTETMANFVKEGALEAGAEVDMFECNEFDASMMDEYDALALGCPSMGDEVLEEDEFQPMYDEISDLLNGKKTLLFGSYGWGDGQWMEDWEIDALACGADVVGTVIANYEPDDTAEQACREAAAKLA